MSRDITVKFHDTSAIEGFVASTTSYTSHWFPKHFHDHYTIQLIDDGVNEGFTQSHRYKIPPGGLLIINPGELHAGNSLNHQPLKFHTLRLDIEFLYKFCQQHEIVLHTDVLFENKPIYDPNLTYEVRQLIAKLNAGLTPESHENIHQLLIGLINKYSAVSKLPKFSNASVKPACEFIQAYYKDEITLSGLAELCHLSPYHFLRVFKKTYGLTPFQYLRNVRIERAKALLPHQSIAQTALQVGFYDHSHFLRNFRKIEGVAPSASKLN